MKKTLLHLLVALAALSPAAAQVGGTRALDDTMRVPTQYHVFKLYKGQRLISPKVDADSLVGAAVGRDVQAYDADLGTWAGITPSANVQTLLGAANYAAFRSSLGNFSALDASDGSPTSVVSVDASGNTATTSDTTYSHGKFHRWGGSSYLATDAGVIEFNAYKTSTTSTSDTLVLTPWIPYKFAGGYTTGITGEVNATCGCYNTSPLAGNVLLLHIGANTTNSHITSLSNVTWDSGGGGSNGNCTTGNFIWGFNGNYARLLYLNTRGNGTQAAIYGKIIGAHNSP